MSFLKTLFKGGNGNKGERGNVVTILLTAVALTGVMGVAIYNLMAGPYASMMRVNNMNLTMNDMMASSRIVIMDAVTSSTGGDCDADGFVEPREYTPPTGGAGSFPSGGGLLPATALGITQSADAWGTAFGYCVWDIGTHDAAGCNGSGMYRLHGTADPTTGDTDTQTVLAVISAGPDRKFQSSCAAYTNGTTSVLTKAGDDIAQTYSYAEAAEATSALWKLRANDTSAITINKNVEVGTGAATIDKTSGLGSFTALSATGAVTATDATTVGTAAATTCSGGSNIGLVKYVAGPPAKLQVCDGTAWGDVTGSSDGGISNGGAPTYDDIVVVQSTTGVAASTSAITTQSFTNPVIAGNAIFVFEFYDDDGVSNFTDHTVTDNEGNTYVRIIDSYPYLMYYANNVQSDGGTFTISINDSLGEPKNVQAVEISGLDAQNSIEQRKTFTRFDSCDGGTHSMSMSLPQSTTVPNELVFSALATQDCGVASEAITPASGWTQLYTDNTGSSNHLASSVAYKIYTAIGPISTSWSYKSASDGYVSLAAFKAKCTANCPADDGETGGGLWNRTYDTANVYTYDDVSIGSATLMKMTSPSTSQTRVMSVVGSGKSALLNYNDDDCWLCHPSLFFGRTNANSSKSSPGDTMGQLFFQSRINANNKVAAKVIFTASAGTIGGTYQTPTNADFYTMNTVGVLNDVLSTRSAKMGLGTTSPTVNYQVKGTPAVMSLDHYYSGTAGLPGGRLVLQSERGFWDKANQSDILGDLSFTGYDQTSYQTVARIRNVVSGTTSAVTSTVFPTDLVFYAGTQTSNLTEAMRLHYNGSSQTNFLGINNNAPAVRFEPDGILLDYAPTSTDTISVTGASKRMMYDQHSGSFYCCEATGTVWNSASLSNAGIYLGYGVNPGSSGGSMIAGYNSTAGASATTAVSIGESDTATANATLIGKTDTSSTDGYSTGIGDTVKPQGYDYTCIGSSMTCGASSDSNNGLALGSAGTVSGNYASIINVSSTSASNTTANSLLIAGGGWGIGTTNPGTYKLSVVGSASNNLSANWTNASDIRLKNIDGNYTKGLADILKLRPVMFHYKKDTGLDLDWKTQQIGFIAQDVKKVFPEGVGLRGDGYYDLDVHPIEVAMVNAFIELKQKNIDIAAQNARWKKRNDDLHVSLDRLKKEVDATKAASTGGTPPALGFLIPAFGMIAAGAYMLRRRKEGRHEK